MSVTEAVEELLAMLAGAPIDEAIILTSFHQSPLPQALLLRDDGSVTAGFKAAVYADMFAQAQS